MRLSAERKTRVTLIKKIIINLQKILRLPYFTA